MVDPTMMQATNPDLDFKPPSGPPLTIEDYRKLVDTLWQLLDNIDTASDAFKPEKTAYYDFVQQQQKRRWQTGIRTDGYALYMPDGTKVEFTHEKASN